MHVYVCACVCVWLYKVARPPQLSVLALKRRRERHFKVNRDEIELEANEIFTFSLVENTAAPPTLLPPTKPPHPPTPVRR